MENYHIFISELDAAMQAHLEWTRRVLRCAVLRISPGNDVLSQEAHSQCRFGKWISLNHSVFDALDPHRTVAMEISHKAMHDAIRNICSKVLSGEPGDESDLGAFETSQTLLVSHLAEFKTLLVQSDSQLDPLTGLPLRHRLEQNFEQMARHASRHFTVPSVMIIDLDKFKEINDRYGHATGDLVLKGVATCIKRALRGEDQVYRYGGEEFVVLSEITSPDGAGIAVQRILDAIRSIDLCSLEGVEIHPTATIGVALMQKGESFKHLLHRADIALYEGKDAGRNRYVISPPSFPA